MKEKAIQRLEVKFVSGFASILYFHLYLKMTLTNEAKILQISKLVNVSWCNFHSNQHPYDNDNVNHNDNVLMTMSLKESYTLL